MTVALAGTEFMNRILLFLLAGGVIVFMGLGYLVHLGGHIKMSPEPRGHFFFWNDGPNLALSPANEKKLNDELAVIIQTDAPGQNFQCGVRAMDKRGIGSAEIGPIPEPLEKKLNAYMDRRAKELVAEQGTP